MWRTNVVTVLLLLFVSSCTSLSWESLTSGLEAWAALSFDANFAVHYVTSLLLKHEALMWARSVACRRDA